MSEDDSEEIEEEFIPKARSPQQKAIADLMYNHNKSYSEAYDIVVLGKKEPETEPQPNLENEINQIKKQRNVELEKTELEAQKLELQAEQLNELKEVSDKQTTQAIELFGYLESELENISRLKKNLETKLKGYVKLEDTLKANYEQYNKDKLVLKGEIAEFNKKLRELREKRRGFARKISEEATKEFNQ